MNNHAIGRILSQSSDFYTKRSQSWSRKQFTLLNHANANSVFFRLNWGISASRQFRDRDPSSGRWWAFHVSGIETHFWWTPTFRTQDVACLRHCFENHQKWTGEQNLMYAECQHHWRLLCWESKRLKSWFISIFYAVERVILSNRINHFRTESTFPTICWWLSLRPPINFPNFASVAHPLTANRRTSDHPFSDHFQHASEARSRQPTAQETHVGQWHIKTQKDNK
jgi:hypothetical protein